MKENFFVSIIIPTYNRKELLRKAINSLLKQSYPEDKYEIIIVDDGSSDKTDELIPMFQKENPGRLRYFFQENRGPSAARNLGIRHARGEIVAFIDSDCIASTGWLESITTGYNNDRIAGIGGTITAIPTGSIINQYCKHIHMNEKPGFNGKTCTTYLITGNASFKKDYLNLVGGFDERYDFPGGEDPDICYRLEKCGYALVYNPDSVVFNPHKQTLLELIRTYFNYGKGESFLSLRFLSRWDLISISGLQWVFYFLKAIGKMTEMFFSNFSLILFLFVRIPFKMLCYYGKEGLTLKQSIYFGFLDFIKRFSFIQGCFFGYIIGKFKGFKISDDANLFILK